MLVPHLRHGSLRHGTRENKTAPLNGVMISPAIQLHKHDSRRALVQSNNQQSGNLIFASAATARRPQNSATGLRRVPKLPIREGT
jgi:hypothetical protein